MTRSLPSAASLRSLLALLLLAVLSVVAQLGNHTDTLPAARAQDPPNADDEAWLAYRMPDEVVQFARDLASAHPEFVAEVETIGRSWQDREIIAVTLTDTRIGAAGSFGSGAVVDVSGPNRPSVQAQPDDGDTIVTVAPINGRTPGIGERLVVTFHSSLRAELEVASFDANGRLVARVLAGTQLRAIQIGDRVATRANVAGDRPLLWIDAGLAGEPIAVQSACYLLTQVVEAAAAGDEPTLELLRRCAIVVVPCANPDALAHTLTTRNPIYTTLRPWDDDRDGRIDEDPQTDIGGDDDLEPRIVQMRVERERGEWIYDPDPLDVEDEGFCVRHLRKADPAHGEVGDHIVLPEGFDADRDGRIAEDGPGGIHLDRTFPARYVGAESQPAAGPHQASEPEARALIDAVLARANLAAVLSLRTDPTGKGPALTYAPCDQPSKALPAADLARFETLSKLAADGVGAAYRERHELGFDADVKDTLATGTASSRGASTTTGGWIDWAYWHMGVPAFRLDVWGLPPAFAKAYEEERTARMAAMIEAGLFTREDPDGDGDPNWPPDVNALDRAWDAWAIRLSSIGFPVDHVSWHAVEHPTLGEVYVGGFTPFVRECPPEGCEGIIDALRRAVATADALARKLPRLTFVTEGCAMETMSEGLVRVSAQLRNVGYLPTHACDMASTTRRARDITLSIDLADGQTLVAGEREVRISPLDGAATTTRVQWIVALGENAASTIRVQATTPRANAVTHLFE